jgi:hypothetical protein
MKHHAMKVYGGVEVQAHTFLTVVTALQPASIQMVGWAPDPIWIIWKIFFSLNEHLHHAHTAWTSHGNCVI